MKAQIRTLLHAVPFMPFTIHMADGKEYHVKHPDFVLAAATEVPSITVEEEDGTHHHLSTLLVTSIDQPGLSQVA